MLVQCLPSALSAAEPHCTFNSPIRLIPKRSLLPSMFCVPQYGHAAANTALPRWQRDLESALSARHPIANQ
jgi:hypothetical protein